MTTLTNFTCWSPEVVTATIATEAASPSDAVLLATHTPLRVRRRGDGETGQVITEEVFIDEFLHGPVKEGVRVAPVIGESGSGKSHLVRWVYAALKESHGRHVIYLPKAQTSLRDVIERLLRDLPGPQFEEVRSKLDGLSEAVSKATLERKILDELAESVREAEVEPRDFLAKALVGDRGLYVLLHDPLFRQYLLEPDSFIPKRAEHALRGRGLDEEDVPPMFTVDDLPLAIANVKNIAEASELARAAFRRISSDPQLQVAAVKLLNDHLDVAVMRAANLGVGSVQNAFMALREHLVGQEIVLLIEDFALIQGIRRDLLDAIVEVGTVGGTEKYAPVRTMMAVTSGYYSALPDTFRTRAEASSPIYVVDVDLADISSGTNRTAINFVGRYLNAARLGNAKLDDAAPSIPNACESCEFIEQCHATFGRSDDGFGLYPYNESALRRAVAITADPDRKSVFNPRRVLARMVRGVLTEQARSIEDGLFPSEDFLRPERVRDSEQALSRRQSDLSLSELSEINERYVEPERTRYLLAFQFWGGVSLEVHPGVYSAFSLPQSDLNFESKRPTSPESPDKESTAPSEAEVIAPALQRQLDEVDGWARGASLPQAVARDVRNIVRRALVADLAWIDPIMKAPGTQDLSRAVPDGTQISRAVSIEGASENLAQGVAPIVRFEQTPANGILFKNLLHFQANPSIAPDALIDLRTVTDRYRAMITTRVIEALSFDQANLVAAAASLLAGAALVGRLPVKPRLNDYVAAVLWSGDGLSRSDASRIGQWTQAEIKYLAERKPTVDAFRSALGASQGIGAVHAVDDPRVRQVVKSALSGVDSLRSELLPPWAQRSDKSRRELEEKIVPQIAEWARVLQEIRTQIPAGVSYLGTVDAIKAAIEVGSTQGFVKANLAEVETTNAEARERDFASVGRLQGTVDGARDSQGMDLWSAVGRADGGEVVAIANYLRYTDSWLAAGLRDAEGRDLVGGLDIDADIDAAISRWDEILLTSDEEGHRE
ncbi:hypothetical protein EV187_2931 [Agromyces ramosus]|uniref:ORC1/DEAH AAA+ ATPase domain-containing protein n=1 Tax=Agromyces ramosus TaxID=33879 RepID=A0A4Q7M9J6_9MICO|nr:protein DpdH [Agromyces ramosus]RZS64544.1 hypothetical protein EV187_2931 [Agromyces ramosus]